MNIWRLMAHHEHPREAADWLRKNGLIHIGWGGTEDLRGQNFHSETDLKRLVAAAHPALGNSANGGRSLWRLTREMKAGDLVIISTAGSRQATMRVSSDYYYAYEEPYYYPHRRRAEEVQIDPNRLWQIADKGAVGEGIYSTLIRCARPITEAEFNALVS